MRVVALVLLTLMPSLPTRAAKIVSFSHESRVGAPWGDDE